MFLKVNFAVCCGTVMHILNGKTPVTKSFLNQIQSKASLSFVDFKQKLTDFNFEERVKEFENSTLLYNLVDFFDYQRGLK